MKNLLSSNYANVSVIHITIIALPLIGQNNWASSIWIVFAFLLFSETFSFIFLFQIKMELHIFLLTWICSLWYICMCVCVCVCVCVPSIKVGEILGQSRSKKLINFQIRPSHKEHQFHSSLVCWINTEDKKKKSIAVIFPIKKIHFRSKIQESCLT